MNLCSIAKSISALTAAVLLFTASGLRPIPVNGSESTALHIENVEITEDMTTATVNVSIAQNTDGFLATSFGIVYDPALTLTEAELVNDAGKAHYYANNPEKGLIWFSGAAADPFSVANTEEEMMFRLHFTLPEDLTVGDKFPISFTWNAADGSQAYWHIDDRSNIIGNIQCWVQNGSISCPDPNAPKLDATALQVATESTRTISILNYEGEATWFSDNTNIATVENGIVAGVSVGACNVYAYIDSSTMLSCRVTVTDEAYYDISETTVIYLRDPDKVVYVQCPDSAQTVNWISDNVGVVTVDADGRLHGLQNGAATIYGACTNQIYKTQVIVEFPTEAAHSYGDVNLDGKQTVVDVIMLNKSILGSQDLNTEQKELADCYQDGTLDAQDSLILLKHLVNLVDSLPVES